MSSLQFANVTDEGIKDFIKQAQKRIIFVKPAFYEWEIKLILDIIEERKIYCELFIEKNDNAIRAGFGDAQALKMIAENQELLHPEVKDVIRMAILVVDNRTLFYMPKIVFIDDEVEQSNFPNGLFGDVDITKLVLDKFPVTQINIPETEEYRIPFELNQIESNHMETVEKELSVVLKKLVDNPPVDPNKLKRIHFYRNNYKLLKIQLRGIKIINRKISLKPFYRLLSIKQERLNSSWDIFLQEDVRELEDMSMFQDEIELLNEEYLFNAGRFGYLIRTEKKQEYTQKMKVLKEEFMSFIKGEISSENRFIKKKEKVNNAKEEKTFKSGISSILTKSRLELTNYLKLLSENDHGFFERMIKEHRYIKRQFENNEINKSEAIDQFTSKYIDDNLKFPHEDDILERINVLLDYYDLSDELIYENEDFKLVLEKYELHEDKVREYEEGLQQYLF